MNYNLLDYYSAAQNPEQIIKRASRCPIGSGFNIASTDLIDFILVTGMLKAKYPDRKYSTRRLAGSDGYCLMRVV
jgi:hypothetical protein